MAEPASYGHVLIKCCEETISYLVRAKITSREFKYINHIIAIYCDYNL